MVDQFYSALKGQGQWWHYVPSTWLIYTDKSNKELAELLRLHLQPRDHIFVGTLQNGFSGWLPKAAWAWIKDRGLTSVSDPDDF
jgi:hypothetical protein